MTAPSKESLQRGAKIDEREEYSYAHHRAWQRIGEYFPQSREEQFEVGAIGRPGWMKAVIRKSSSKDSQSSGGHEIPGKIEKGFVAESEEQGRGNQTHERNDRDSFPGFHRKHPS